MPLRALNDPAQYYYEYYPPSIVEAGTAEGLMDNGQRNLSGQINLSIHLEVPKGSRVRVLVNFEFFHSVVDIGVSGCCNKLWMAFLGSSASSK